MKKIILLILISFCLFGCTLTKTQTKSRDLPFPPNGIPLTDITYIDKSEITNISWAEYQYHMKKIFGQDSPEYRITIPDTTCWTNKYDTITDGEGNKVNYPKYNNYPIVGISQQQAAAYTAWRTDRVLEMILITKHNYKPDPHQDSASYFTEKKFFDNKLKNFPSKENLSITYPVFRLPNEKDIESALDTFDTSLVDEIELFQKAQSSSLIKSSENEYSIRPVSSGSEFPSGLLNNVNEWLNTPHTSYNGYLNPDNILKISYNTNDERNCNVGFRNVSEFKTVHLNSVHKSTSSSSSPLPH